MTTLTEPTDLELDTLRNLITGPVLSREDPGFAEELSGQNLAVIQSPDVVVGATSRSDISEAVRFAARYGLSVRVLATGHGAELPITDGLIITTRRLDALSIDPHTRIATIGAGVRWGAVIAAAGEHGLLPITGASGTVGAIGYTLGGGLGPLSRSYGVSSDYARGFEVVAADGRPLRANATENPDLFWALRGGKGGLGIVTEMEFELVPLRTIYGGSIFFDEPQIEPVLRGWVDWTATASTDVTTSVAIMRLPDLDVIPVPLRGKTVLSLRFAYPLVDGHDEKTGEQLVAPLRALGPAILDVVQTIPVTLVGTIHNDPPDPGPGWTAGWELASVDQDFAGALLGAVGPGRQVPLISVEIRHLGGQTTVDVPEGSAVGGREGAFTVMLVGAPDPSLFAGVLPGVAAGVEAAIAPWKSPVTTINFTTSGLTPEEESRCWPPQILDRLKTVRSRYDPSAIFAYGPSAG